MNSKDTLADNKSYIVVAGGINIDIGGKSDKALIMEDSNPGYISVSLGGVGRNIAHNLSILGCNVKLLSAIGDDHNAVLVMDSCAGLGIDIADSYFAKGEVSSTYLFINQPDGDMALAVNDMRICRHLTPEFFADRLSIMNGASLVVMDANLPKESIEYIAHNVKVPIFADVVSTLKGVNVLPVIDKIHSIKANRLEAQVLTGIEISDDESLEKAARAFLKMGVLRAYISLGDDGMLAASEDGIIKVPAYKTEVVSTTGAGDAAMAALAFAYGLGLGTVDAIKCANKAASLTIGSLETVSDKLNRDVLLSVL